ncbi:MAG: methyltransferase domain-containing protein [candidate division Zixibacteria bacterium]|nr:methyltransferase domain-containing protein [candidate division Zixibacteria bacterium]
MRALYYKFANLANPNSLSTRLRKKRFQLFRSFIDDLEKPFRLLDVGGAVIFWEAMGFINEPGVDITLLNLDPYELRGDYPNVNTVVGDGRDMKEFGENEFDIVTSNSVIEHVGDFDNQRRMANEIMRVGKRYFVQTPNVYFPVEPHVILPFAQFYPLWFKIWLGKNFDLGPHKKTEDKQAIMAFINSLRLLSKRELRQIFPDAEIWEEKVWGLTKSFIAYGEC